MYEYLRYDANTEKIRVGTFSELEIDNIAYAVVSFPIQEDQAFLPWYQPVDPSGAMMEDKETFDALDSSRGGFGGFTFSWIFGQLTPLMVKYIRDTIFSTTKYSENVTVMSFDRSYGWRAINCIAVWNDPARSAEPVGLQGYQKLKIDFVNGVAAPYGRGFDRGFDSGFG